MILSMSVLQEVGKEIVRRLKGSILALACIGNHLQGKESPDDWRAVSGDLTARLCDSKALPSDYRRTPFAVLDLVADGLAKDASLPEELRKAVVPVLNHFRPGVPIPFALIKLAVEVETQREWAADRVTSYLDKLVKANVLEEYGESAFVKASKGRKGYRLLDLVAMWLTECRQGGATSILFQGSTGQARPSADAQAGHDADDDAATEHLRRCSLLEAFLTSFGKVPGEKDGWNMPEQAVSFFRGEAVECEHKDWYCADLTLSDIPHLAAHLASEIEGGLTAETVLAEVLKLRGDTPKG
jgi:hypothetical protein